MSQAYLKEMKKRTLKLHKKTKHKKNDRISPIQENY